MSQYFKKWVNPLSTVCETKHCRGNSNGYERNGYLVGPDCTSSSGYMLGDYVEYKVNGISKIFKSIKADNNNTDNPLVGIAKTPPTWEEVALLPHTGTGGTDTYDVFGLTYQEQLPSKANATYVSKKADGTTEVKQVNVAFLENSVDPVKWPNGLWCAVSDMDAWVLTQEV